MNDDSKRVIYVPPKAERINRYAKDVCKALAARRGNEDVAKPEIANGLAELLRILFSIHAKELNGEL